MNALLTLLLVVSLHSRAADPPATPSPAPTERSENAAISQAGKFDDLGSLQVSDNELLPAGEFLEMSLLDSIPEGLVEWSPNSVRFLYLKANELPYVYFIGKLKAGYELYFQKEYIAIDRQTSEFSIRVPLRLKPMPFEFRVISDRGELFSFRMINYWLKLPSTFSYRVKTKSGITDVGRSFYTQFESSAFVQLHARERAVQVVDLDAVAFADLTFRVYAPPIREEVYDGWELTIRTEAGSVVARARRYGHPPAFVDWREMGLGGLAVGHYTYQMNLFVRNKVFEGAPNQFHAYEGRTIANHEFLPDLMIHLRGELGMFQFKNGEGVSTMGPLVGATMGAVIKRSYVLRASGHSSIHGLDPNNTYAHLSVGAGLRFSKEVRGWMGYPSRHRIDITANYSSIVTPLASSLRRLTVPTVLVDWNMVLWNDHLITPWFEVGLHPTFSVGRMSAGLGYDFYLRKWSIRIGVNAAYDWVFLYTTSDAARFNVVRAGTSIAFDLQQ